EQLALSGGLLATLRFDSLLLLVQPLPHLLRVALVVERGDGAGVTGQELAVGSAVQAGVGLLDRLLGGEGLLPGGGWAADAQQASDLGDLEAALTVQEEVAQHSCRVVVAALLLAEAEGGLEQAALRGRQTPFGDLALSQPVGERLGRGRHENPSRANSRGIVYSVVAQS